MQVRTIICMRRKQFNKINNILNTRTVIFSTHNVAQRRLGIMLSERNNMSSDRFISPKKERKTLTQGKLTPLSVKSHQNQAALL